jgi:hypothetical protein
MLRQGTRIALRGEHLIFETKIQREGASGRTVRRNCLKHTHKREQLERTYQKEDHEEGKREIPKGMRNEGLG